MTKIWIGLLLLALLGCDAKSEGGASSTAPTAKSGSAPPLHILLRSRPDPAVMAEALAPRMESCIQLMRSRGVTVQRPPMPTPAEIAQWVGNEEEDFFDGDRHALFSTWSFFDADWSDGCRWKAYKSVMAQVEEVCGERYSGSARAVGGAAGLLGANSPPDFVSEPERTDGLKSECLAEASERQDWMLNKPWGVTRTGARCRWIEDLPGVSGTAPVEPQAPGLHVCVHPSYYDGSRVRPKGTDLTLRVFTILPPGQPLPRTYVFTPDGHMRHLEAELVEEGKPIPAARMSRAAVEAFVRQPLRVPPETVPFGQSK